MVGFVVGRSRHEVDVCRSVDPNEEAFDAGEEGVVTSCLEVLKARCVVGTVDGGGHSVGSIHCEVQDGFREGESVDCFEGDGAGLRADGQDAVVDFGVEVVSHIGWNTIAELIEVVFCYVASDNRGVPYVAAGVHELDEGGVVIIPDRTRLGNGWWERFG